jgi:hypothetical protein
LADRRYGLLDFRRRADCGAFLVPAMSAHDGGDAFPSPGVVLTNQGGLPQQQGAYAGMTLRDYFAAKAMQTLLLQLGKIPSSPADIADAAYGMAASMLKARDW